MNKIILTLMLVAMAAFAKAQKVSEDQVKQVLQADAVESLNELFNDENVNQCIVLKSSDYNILSLAIKYEAKKVFAALLKEYKVDLNSNCAGKTPLMYAAKYGKVAMASELLSAGADHTFENDKGRTALDYAKKYKQPELVELLEGFQR